MNNQLEHEGPKTGVLHNKTQGLKAGSSGLIEQLTGYNCKKNSLSNSSKGTKSPSKLTYSRP